MTSGRFESVSLAAIVVPPERQRTERSPEADRALEDSIRRLGLIHPPVVDHELVLIAGEGRLRACARLGWTHIPVQFSDEIDEATRFAMELEENTRRQALTWQEEVLATERYHKMRSAEEADWSMEKTGAAIGLDAPRVSRHITVAKHLSVPEVASATTLSKAINTAGRVEERQRARELMGIVANDKDAHSPIIHADFHEWAANYAGPPFNFIHCDFPYGINIDKSEGQNSALSADYEDGPLVYSALMNTLIDNQYKLLTDSAHLIFWFSPDYYHWTFDSLEMHGWKVEPHPLIWVRGLNEGIAPDTQRRPRRIYDMAFFAWRGDARLSARGTRANVFVAPTERTRHSHEKSEVMLRHFFEMIVDETTSILDPTCGSGSALVAAKALGASRLVGVEQNEVYARVARGRLS